MRSARSTVVAMTSGNIGTLIRHRGLVMPYLVWLAGFGFMSSCESPQAATRSRDRKTFTPMAIVDEHGRLFGRFNLFDAIVAVLALWLIPIAYGGYLLLRSPLATLTGSSRRPSSMATA